MKSTKKSTKRTEEYRIHLEQSLHYRRRCRASYALFKELQEKNLLTIDEPFKSQIEAVIAPEPKTECEKKYDEKNEIKWNNYFQQYKQYCDALTTLSQNGQTVVFPSSSMTYFTDLSSQSFNKIWLFRQRDKFAKKILSEQQLQQLQTIEDWNIWTSKYKPKQVKFKDIYE